MMRASRTCRRSVTQLWGATIFALDGKEVEGDWLSQATDVHSATVEVYEDNAKADDGALFASDQRRRLEFCQGWCTKEMAVKAPAPPTSLSALLLHMRPCICAPVLLCMFRF